MDNVGGIPFEKSNGLETSTRILPFKFSATANSKPSRECSPFVQLKITSPNIGASEKLPEDVLEPFFEDQVNHLSFVELRAPIFTSWPHKMSLDAIVSSTNPVPKIPIFIKLN
ncbi:MAG: hypothetical protein H7329_01005 [Opitutaceae bacterium]|nr:hypothetical protein [Cytophagales bacterium]